MEAYSHSPIEIAFSLNSAASRQQKLKEDKQPFLPAD